MYSRYKRQWIFHFVWIGYKQPTIWCMLREEGSIANRMRIHKFLWKHRETNNIERRPGSGRPTKMKAAVKAFVERPMRDNDEMTAVHLHALLLRHGHTMSLKTALGLFCAYCSEAVPFASVIKWIISSDTGTSQWRNCNRFIHCPIVLYCLFSDKLFWGQWWIILEQSVHFV